VQLVDKSLITSSAEPQRSTVEARAERNAMTEEEIDAALNDDELDLEVMLKEFSELCLQLVAPQECALCCAMFGYSERSLALAPRGVLAEVRLVTAL